MVIDELQALFVLVLSLTYFVSITTLRSIHLLSKRRSAGLALMGAGGLLTVTSPVSPLMVGGLLLAGLGWMLLTGPGLIRAWPVKGLMILIVALALCAYSVLHPAAGDIWLAGCALLMLLAPLVPTTLATPLGVRSVSQAIGLPALAGYAFVAYATQTQAHWSSQVSTVVLVVGVLGLSLAAINAVVAPHLGVVFSWQLVAQLALLLVVFGTGQAAAGPIAAGLLAQAILTATSLALAIGILHQATGSEHLAMLPPLGRPLTWAGLAYGMAALSSAGIPPLLGYALKRVVVLLAAPLSWLPALLLATATLLALSYLPTLVAFFRCSPAVSVSHIVRPRTGLWPLGLMAGLLAAGAVPDPVWQWILGDPAVSRPQAPPVAALVQTGLAAVLVLGVAVWGWRELRRIERTGRLETRPTADTEDVQYFTALRRALRFLVLLEQTRMR